MAQALQAGNSRTLQLLALQLVLLLVLLLASLPSGGIRGAAAQNIQGGSTRRCGMTSVQLTMRSADFVWNLESEYRRLMGPFEAPGRYCPYNMVCAQMVTAIERQGAIYGESCWELSGITEYTEVACFADLCNRNLTFGSFPRLPSSNIGTRSAAIQCYNHGQLQNRGRYDELISGMDYQYQFYRPMPVSHWSSGMCGAAIYASGARTRIIHERVLTGDRVQKFAMLRVCPASGCDRNVARDVVLRGFHN